MLLIGDALKNYMMEQSKTEQLKNEIDSIKERNRRVERDKAWETSLTRIVSIAVLTYVVALIVMCVLSVPKPFLNALIPTLGFILSVQTLPVIKKCWIKKHGHR